MKKALVTMSILALMTSFSWSQAQNNSFNEVLIISGATLIQGNGSAPLENQTVVVREGRIAEIVDAENYQAPANTTVIDANGKWLIPGLADMHVHASGASPVMREIFRTMLGFGITTTRNNASAGTNGIQTRAMLNDGRLLGPRMFVAGPLLDTPGGMWSWAAVVESEEEVRAEVKRQAELGVDFVKFYVGLNPELVQAGVEEAQRLGVKTIGHLEKTSWSEAADFGIDNLVHTGLYGPTWELSDSANRDSYSPTDILPTLDLTGPKAVVLAKQLAEQNVVVDPNLVMIEAVFWGNEQSHLDALEPQYAPVGLARSWQGRPNQITTAYSSAQIDALKQTFPNVLAFVKLLHDSGVTLVSGTDLMNPWMTPGVALHRELELLSQAGIANLDVLTIATRNAAISLGELENFGTIEAGKSADMVILTANPLQDIRNTRSIEWVIKEGKIFSPTELLPTRLSEE